jgi:hypothetical protein
MQTVQEIREQVETAKRIAMANFKRDWGTDNISVVMEALASLKRDVGRG